ncbi:MAG: heavy-metal-associated domain-containing protein [Salinivirgaceae bacterium]
MKTLTFKTSINCGGCVAKVTPALDGLTGIDQWSVDTNNPDKILTVQTDGLSEEEIVKKVQESGFKIERIVG